MDINSSVETKNRINNCYDSLPSVIQLGAIYPRGPQEPTPYFWTACIALSAIR